LEDVKIFVKIYQNCCPTVQTNAVFSNYCLFKGEKKELGNVIL